MWRLRRFADHIEKSLCHKSVFSFCLFRQGKNL